MKALFDENPKPRYLTVPTQQQAYWTIDREALVEILDAALARQSVKVVQ
jgi:hypothetical protein